MTPARLRTLWLIGLVGYLGLIAAASLLPPPNLPLNPGGYDKLWHAAAYALAAFACVPLLRPWSRLLGAGLGLIGYGLLMELLQGLGGVRSFDLLDGLANAVGVGLGLCGGFSRLRGALEPSSSPRPSGGAGLA